MMQTNFSPLDKDIEKRQALAKIYSLLIKLAEEVENESPKLNQQEENSEPLKNNNPTGQ